MLFILKFIVKKQPLNLHGMHRAQQQFCNTFCEHQSYGLVSNFEVSI